MLVVQRDASLRDPRSLRGGDGNPYVQRRVYMSVGLPVYMSVGPQLAKSAFLSFPCLLDRRLYL